MYEENAEKPGGGKCPCPTWADAEEDIKASGQPSPGADVAHREGSADNPALRVDELCRWGNVQVKGKHSNDPCLESLGTSKSVLW